MTKVNFALSTKQTTKRLALISDFKFSIFRKPIGRFSKCILEDRALFIFGHSKSSIKPMWKKNCCCCWPSMIAWSLWTDIRICRSLRILNVYWLIIALVSPLCKILSLLLPQEEGFVPSVSFSYRTTFAFLGHLTRALPPNKIARTVQFRKSRTTLTRGRFSLLKSHPAFLRSTL